MSSLVATRRPRTVNCTVNQIDERLCDTCDRLCRIGLPYPFASHGRVSVDYHSTFAELLEAVAKGCRLCNVFYDAAQHCPIVNAAESAQIRDFRCLSPFNVTIRWMNFDREASGKNRASEYLYYRRAQDAQYYGRAQD